MGRRSGNIKVDPFFELCLGLNLISDAIVLLILRSALGRFSGWVMPAKAIYGTVGGYML